MLKTFASALVLAALCGTLPVQAGPLENALQTQRFIERSRGDMMPTIVSVSRPVTYSDLDLSKASDVAELHHRVTVAAAAACRQLDKRYPAEVYQGAQDDNCVKASSEQAMAGINRAVHVASN